MFPRLAANVRRELGFPHAGGDVSRIAGLFLLAHKFSPRRWGCFLSSSSSSSSGSVFPTQVGMFLCRGRRSSAYPRFPHAGGDVSRSELLKSMWALFSPRRWGCFSKPVCPCTFCLVFPTQVGMFPPRRTSCDVTAGFPHAGGDVSATEGQYIYYAMFSPRRWGCFYRTKEHADTSRVFPTQVGMFLRHSIGLHQPFGFPHAGGDVS